MEAEVQAFVAVTAWRWAVSFTPRPLYPRGKSRL